MRVTASAGRNRRYDIRFRASELDLRADTDLDREILSAIYRCIVLGERLEIEPDGKGNYWMNPKRENPGHMPGEAGR